MSFFTFFKNDFSLKTETKKINRRIWVEVFKVLASSDIIFFILDARDPLGCWCNLLKKKIYSSKKKKILVLNKCDLVPRWVILKWIKIFSKDNLIIAFNSRKEKSSGKNLIYNLIRQLKKSEYPFKKNFIIGVIGYPNVGKSTLINTLKGKKVVSTSSKTGKTRVWQFIKLYKNLYVIDSPGIIPNLFANDSIKLIRGFLDFDKISKKNFEIFSIFEKIMRITGKYIHSKTKKKSFFSTHRLFPINTINLEKGGKKDETKFFISQLKDFIEGKKPWYAPIPTRKKKKTKK